MVKKLKKKPFLIFFVSVLTFLSALFLSINVAYADGKELTDVVTDISVLNMSDSKLEPNADGTYQIITNRTNQFFVQFDLKQYDGKLANGDYFDVDIPTPVTVYNGTTELYDKETKVNIGTVVVTANGDNQGGKARVTLKNLDEFQAKTGGDIVKGVKGNYAITFLFKSDQTATPLTFENKGVGKTITHTFTSKTVDSKQEGFENYAKVGNDVVSKEWTSEKLAAIGSVGKGDIYSPWRIRVNTGRQDYGKNLVLNDFLPNTAEFAPIQYIPESLVVYSSATLNDGTSQVPSDAKKMVEGTDYTVAWNENYTQFNLIFADGSKSYWVEYHTTTPGDGRKVQNVIQLTTADGTALTQRSNRTNLDFKSERVSLVKGQIEASTAFKIKINKTNAFTLVPVAGAVYTVKSEDGTISTELTTNEKGEAISDEFDQKYVGKTFIIKEKTAPAGYTLDEKEYKVTLGAEGSKINIQDEPIAADFSITAKKVIAGNRPVALKDGEFKFDLYNANNLTTPIASTTNKADGSITFEGLKAKGPGTYNYVIKENTKTKVPGITFDENSYEVTVDVKAEGGTLKAEVTTKAPTLTNTYEPSPARATFKATKELVGKELAKEQFEFELSEGGNVIVTSSNGKTVNGVEAATNEVVFSVLYTEAGDHEYTITEKAGTEEGVTYSKESYTVHVKVVDNGEGKLVATVKEVDADRKFTNTYVTTTTTTTTTPEPTTTTTTTPEPTTTTTTTPEPTTTTTTPEPTTTTTTTPEPTTTTTTTPEPTTTTTTITPEPTTTTTPELTTTTTTPEPTTTTTTTPEPTTTTTTPEPTTTTTTPEPTTPPTPYVPNDGSTTTTTTTTTEEPVVTETTTTTPEPTTPPTPYVPNDGSTTTEEPTVSTSVSTEITTVAASEKTAPSVLTTEDKPGLPFTGEATSAVLVLAGVVVLSGTVVMKRKFTK
ncbi:FctA domain-containing protein [Streptococcus sp. Marseille-Q3533]|uniref:Spy0128 family protein n=1 Tax=Streptococcus sp. Marseille-Q3533 TaxID=2759692 RepID=UPI0032EA3E2B